MNGKERGREEGWKELRETEDRTKESDGMNDKRYRTKGRETQEAT